MQEVQTCSVRVYPAQSAEAEAGFSIQRAIPGPQLQAVGPFVMIDHYGPAIIPAGGRFGFPPHPHAGIATVSLLVQGRRRHRDSLGNDVEWSAGDVQWMSAGRGIVHEEGLARDFKRTGGVIEGFQIWFNLPASGKQSDPCYEHVPAERVSRHETSCAAVTVVAGEIEVDGQTVVGPVTCPTPAQLGMADIAAGGHVRFAVPAGHELAFYVAHGTASVLGQPVSTHQIAVVAGTKVTVAIASTGQEPVRIVFLGGLPSVERAVFYGPFVMSTEEEMRDTRLRYMRGDMGALAPEGTL